MSKTLVNAYAATRAKGPLEPFTYDLSEIGPEQVDIRVEFCGLCHSDLSMLDNDWGMTAYPFVPGHEVVGTIERTGEHVKGLSVGDRVGLGWFSGSCMHCAQCLSGSHHLCAGNEQTIVGRYGGFADIVRGHWAWATPIPKELDQAKVGPLFCGGITVFNPILKAGVLPTDRVGVIGIGGLGHMALQFLNKWGCEVTAFTSSPGKEEEARSMGAHRVVNSRDADALRAYVGYFDFILNTTNVSLDWPVYLELLGPKGVFHTVGAVLEPMGVPAFSLITGEKSVAGSPLGSPALTRTMLEFCARHTIAPVTEEFAMKDINEAFDHLRSGKARYRIVLKS
ncbi:MAG TPA: NAD(P)-dependent alcohol dehydrogenase [Thermoanaerobaculia bacterium]|nr:NAD(P)-dependent alcohol dehydrogenase [Thermoanaerobaculia bacterium]HUM31082.1 NAD(P)-dependent alcohol dehydrogenase [Thermoanaerobaculia bacterium]HXK69406.1 NAD(P)-dependent alcohol dehydrogenase [Thermoanaerobaculia bacterium]